MSVWLLFEERRSQLWGLRGLLLLIAIAALGYSGWIYFDQYWYQRHASEAFDTAREAGQAPATAEPFRAKLTIPRLRLTAMVEDGVGENVLRRAAGHIPHTSLPGRPGNVGLAAHRDTLFSRLRGIKSLDRIVLSTPTVDYNYQVVSTSIVNPDDVSVLAPSQDQKLLTLVTCYPFEFFGHAPKRFIVRAEQIDENARMNKPAQAAEDAGVITNRRQQREEKLAKMARHAREQADSYARQTRIDSQRRADVYLDASRGPVAQNTELRIRLLERLNGVLATRDTPHGLVVTVPNAAFSGALLRGTVSQQVTLIAAIVAAHPGLEIEVVGHTDSAATEPLSWRRAEAVRRVILDYGLAPNAVAARGLGNMRPLDSNATAAGREQNPRTEIVISGDPIGKLPTWDRAYTLTMR